MLGVLLLVATAVGAAPEASATTGQLQSGTVPSAFEPWVLKAGALCSQVGAPLVAAQLAAESGFDPLAVSPVGAQGAAQFMPYTWPGYGVDSDGNGVASPFDVGDAVMAQGRFDCELVGKMQAALDAGRVSGDVTDLMLAAYNAGPGAVYGAGGIPQNGETPAYVSRIRTLEAKYTQIGTGPSGHGVVPGGPFATNLPYRRSQLLDGHPLLVGGWQRQRAHQGHPRRRHR